jgi:MerR family transcriptional regulator, copper efflux regulator
MMKIGDVAHQAGLTTTTIRYYEDIGLVPPPDRAPNGYRDYGPEAVERLRFIRDAQDSGLSLSDVASILELRGQGESTCHHVIELMERHLADVDRRIERLQASRDVYAGLIARAKHLDPADCTDPARCQTIVAAADPEHHAEHAPELAPATLPAAQVREVLERTRRSRSGGSLRPGP